MGAVKVGVISFYAILLMGCGSTPWAGEERSNSRVAAISLGEARACKFIADVTATGASPQDADPTHAAMDRLRLLTLGKAGNAYVTVDFGHASAQSGETVTVAAKVYSCNS